MGLISEKDQEFIDFIRGHINLPDWSLAMAIWGFLGLQELNYHPLTDNFDEWNW